MATKTLGNARLIVAVNVQEVTLQYHAGRLEAISTTLLYGSPSDPSIRISCIFPAFPSTMFKALPQLQQSVVEKLPTNKFLFLIRCPGVERALHLAHANGQAIPNIKLFRCCSLAVPILPHSRSRTFSVMSKTLKHKTGLRSRLPFSTDPLPNN